MCTGNICRSPLAEHLLRRHLHERRVDATVRSAGLLEDGRPATTTGLESGIAMGVDLTSHRSRRLSEAMIRSADLIVTMARHHLRDVIVRERAAMSKAFTLKELVRRAEAARSRPPDVDLADWIAGLAAGRRREDLLDASTDDDVADPIGQARPVYDRMGAEVDDLLRRLVLALWP